MPRKNKKDANRGINNLANFTLISEQRRLIMTSDALSEIKDVKKKLAKFCPDNNYVIESFGVKMLMPRPLSDVIYKRFEKVSGYSLWQVLT